MLCDGHLKLKKRVMLYDISWQQFKNLSKDLGHWAAKLAYDRTTLEIIRPLPEHKDYQATI